jgi:hypothetical protein
MPSLIDGNQIGLTNPLEVTTIAWSAGGSLPYHKISLASDNATVVKGAPSCLYGVNVSNANGAARYIKFYDKVAVPLATDIPVLTIYLPATSSINKVFAVGVSFLLGLGYRCTTGIADNDSGAVGAADLSIDFDYK